MEKKTMITSPPVYVLPVVVLLTPLMMSQLPNLRQHAVRALRLVHSIQTNHQALMEL